MPNKRGGFIDLLGEDEAKERKGKAKDPYRKSNIMCNMIPMVCKYLRVLVGGVSPMHNGSNLSTFMIWLFASGECFGAAVKMDSVQSDAAITPKKRRHLAIAVHQDAQPHPCWSLFVYRCGPRYR